MKIVGILAVALLICAGAVYCLYDRQPAPTATHTPPTQQVRSDPAEGAVRTILDSEAGYEERLTAIQQLPKALSPKHVESLRGLVNTKGVHPTIRNNLVEVLAAQPAKPIGIADELIKMHRDSSEESTWRDYCLQHLALVHDFSSDKDAIEATLLEVAASKSDGKSNYPGTALLSLEKLAKKYSRVAESLSGLSRKGVSAHAEDPERAVTALQVARAAKDKSVLPEARKIAADEKALVRLRMSAIGTLGELGAQEDLALLNQLAEAKESRIKIAAAASLESLAKALGAK